MQLNPVTLIKEAVKNVPSLKYVWGIIASLAIISLTKYLSIDFKTALIGAPIIIAFIYIIAILGNSISVAKESFKPLALFVTWSLSILFILVLALVTSSLFFNFPLALNHQNNTLPDNPNIRTSTVNAENDEITYSDFELSNNKIANPKDYLSNPSLTNQNNSLPDKANVGTTSKNADSSERINNNTKIKINKNL